MRKRLRSISEPSEIQPPYASIAEALFIPIIERMLEDLQTKLPPGVQPQQMATWVLNFLDCAAQPVQVRSRSGKVSSVRCLDKIERQLVAADPTEYKNIVVPFWTSPDFRALQPLLCDLREQAEGLGLKDEDVDSALRRQLTTPRKHQLGIKVRTLHDYLSSHSPEVQRRLIALSTYIAEEGESITDRAICTRWDYDQVPVPAKWTKENDITKWVSAYTKQGTRGRLQRMISGHRKALGIKRKQVF